MLYDVNEKLSDFADKLVDEVPDCACHMKDAFDELRGEIEIAGDILVGSCATLKSIAVMALQSTTQHLDYDCLSLNQRRILCDGFACTNKTHISHVRAQVQAQGTLLGSFRAWVVNGRVCPVSPIHLPLFTISGCDDL